MLFFKPRYFFQLTAKKFFFLNKLAHGNPPPLFPILLPSSTDCPPPLANFWSGVGRNPGGTSTGWSGSKGPLFPHPPPSINHDERLDAMWSWPMNENPGLDLRIFARARVLIGAATLNRQHLVKNFQGKCSINQSGHDFILFFKEKK
jgi:hypothetical protein